MTQRWRLEEPAAGTARPRAHPRPPAPPGGKVQRGPVNNSAGRAHRATGRRRVAPSGGRGHFQERRPQPPPAGPLSRPRLEDCHPGPPHRLPQTCPRAAPHRPAAPTARRRPDPPEEGRPSHSPEPRRGATRLTAASEPGGRRERRSGDSLLPSGRLPSPLPSAFAAASGRRNPTRLPKPRPHLKAPPRKPASGGPALPGEPKPRPH